MNEENPNQLLRKELEGSRPIAIWGIGREGKSSVSKFLSWGWQPGKDFDVFANLNPRDNDSIEGIAVKSEQSLLENHQRYHLILKSPGIPLHQFPELNGYSVLNQMALALKVFGHQSIGITGTKGKSTCATLVRDIFVLAGYHTVLAGNIGVPPFDAVTDQQQDWYIFECSSFQLEQVRHSPRFSLVLDLYPEHLDYHKDWSQYLTAKSHIFIHQQGEKACSSCYLTPIAYEEYLKSECVESNFLRNHTIHKMSQTDLDSNTIPSSLSLDLRHQHYIPMLNAVRSLSRNLGIKPKVIEGALKTFKGLKHRMQPYDSPSGRRFVNDSISTIPQSTICALQAEPLAGCVIVGGKSRGLDQSPLIEFIFQWKGEVIAMEATGQEIKNEIQKRDSKRTIFSTNSLKEAVEISIEICRPEQSCVFSPGAPTSKTFRDFEARGDAFLEAVDLI